MQEPGCLFCRIAARTVPADIVAEADGLLAFKDIHPQAPTHLLVIPTEHIPSLNDLSLSHTTLMGQAIHFMNRLARQYRVSDTGYRVVLNTGAQAGQSVPHLHFHLLGGRAFQWPPG